MKKLCLLLFISAIGCSAIGQNAYWQQEVHYTIDVSLNDTEHSLEGFLKLQYINHSPDTLRFIWFHLWPNAFKNDRTAFSEQALQNGKTDFYFSPREKRGYINRLDFRVDNNTLKTEDHPQFIDIIKVYLPAPLLPGQATAITTPFHVQLPANFSRGGHTGHSYKVTQWYPKPAVYDRLGWHPMPYLDQGEFYGEFGSFDVRISVPDKYVVAATGELQDEAEKQWLKERASFIPPVPVKTKSGFQKKPVAKKAPVKKTTGKPSHYTAKSKKEQPAEIAKQPPIINHKQQTFKTLQYKQNNVHDFAWFADSNFVVKQDTIQLSSGRVVQAMSFYRSAQSDAWANSVQFIKDAVHYRSNLIGEYPYNVVSVVEAKMGFEGGMEYPTITSISPDMDSKSLDMTIEHEVGHNWFMGILGSNERDHPWMDEGVNSYFDDRYKAMKYPEQHHSKWILKRMPDNASELAVDMLAKIKKDQPAALPSPDFTSLNYSVIVYMKTGILVKHLENAMGTQRFDSCMQAYYRQWQFRHPYPQDFQQSFTVGDGKAATQFFDSLQQKGGINPMAHPKKLKPVFLGSFKNYDSVNYINLMPVMGYNVYDHFMIGLALHNYSLPAHNLQYFLAPMYATGSKVFVGIGRVGYTWRPNNTFEKIDLSVSGAHFSTLDGADSNANKITAGFYKVAPALRFTFANKDPRSSIEKWLEWRTFFIWENGFQYVQKSEDGEFYPSKGKTTQRYLNQVSFNVANYRVLYPYDVRLQVQQGDGFYRASATGNYYFNYASSGGLQMRVFAAKFGYIGAKTVAKQFSTFAYQPKLTAVRGNEDYTYSNYFIGRNENTGLASQQIMMRDGGLKIRTDLFQGLQGRSDDWIASMNLATTLPKGLLPLNLPVKIFLDAGTYADAWKKNAATSRFLYVAGLQVNLLKDLLNVYVPIVYSKEFRDNLKTVPDENTFFKKISFSIDVHRFNIHKATENKIPF
ncbi:MULTISPECIES: M1 family metallopeptidase [Niastella]|uniref:M1 family metallopeptidase n=1 Tax=Niastella soli TaxID=2821487 RepID=A0ABS3YTX3_9BACT|nr:M1 family metallopeptidase [Niastella soli]MBO9201379.1 M1 family metallopeptidase [Niastella soli]